MSNLTRKALVLASRWPTKQCLSDEESHPRLSLFGTGPVGEKIHWIAPRQKPAPTHQSYSGVSPPSLAGVSRRPSQKKPFNIAFYTYGKGIPSWVQAQADETGYVCQIHVNPTIRLLSGNVWIEITRDRVLKFDKYGKGIGGVHEFILPDDVGINDISVLDNSSTAVSIHRFTWDKDVDPKIANVLKLLPTQQREDDPITQAAGAGMSTPPQGHRMRGFLDAFAQGLASGIVSKLRRVQTEGEGLLEQGDEENKLLSPLWCDYCDMSVRVTATKICTVCKKGEFLSDDRMSESWCEKEC
ncbi:Fc.00g082270.m01.CDS01 [Cosmosporella sp. VM-42]